jgi:hypothetical protein
MAMTDEITAIEHYNAISGVSTITLAPMIKYTGMLVNSCSQDNAAIICIAKERYLWNVRCVRSKAGIMNYKHLAFSRLRYHELFYKHFCENSELHSVVQTLARELREKHHQILLQEKENYPHIAIMHLSSNALAVAVDHLDEVIGIFLALSDA